MTKVPYRVFVVLDGEFGSQLSELNTEGPIWVIDTPTNRAAVQEIWSKFPSRNHPDGVTIFTAFGNSNEEILVNELDMIDLHHGEHSADPPYTVLEITGVSLTPRIEKELSSYGFNDFCALQQGFRATRPLPGD